MGRQPGWYLHANSVFAQSICTAGWNTRPTFHKSFTTQWNANRNYEWDESSKNNFGKEDAIVGKKLNTGDLAIKIVMPQDADYAAEVSKKATANYLVVDYKDVYDDANKNVITERGAGENMFRYFYPSLNKHNSSNYYVANANKKRNGNLNATFIIRMAEIYLIAAEADIYLMVGLTLWAILIRFANVQGLPLSLVQLLFVQYWMNVVVSYVVNTAASMI